jgi:hypothetical protein
MTGRAALFRDLAVVPTGWWLDLIPRVHASTDVVVLQSGRYQVRVSQ